MVKFTNPEIGSTLSPILAELGIALFLALEGSTLAAPYPLPTCPRCRKPWHLEKRGRILQQPNEAPFVQDAYRYILKSH